MSPQARSRPIVQARLALTLALVAGAVDAIGVLTLAGLFTAHMSGNTARLGVALSQGDLRRAAPLAAAIGLFVAWIAAGALLAALLDDRAGAWRTPALLGAETTLLVALLVAGALLVDNGEVRAQAGLRFYVLAALAIGAIGIQASVLSRVGDQPVRTTYISGVLTNLAQQLAAALRGEGAALRRAVVLAGVAGGYLAGATGGGVLQARIHLWSAAAPATVLLITAITCGPERASAAGDGPPGTSHETEPPRSRGATCPRQLRT
jgi:oxalate decarboxylase